VTRVEGRGTRGRTVSSDQLLVNGEEKVSGFSVQVSGSEVFPDTRNLKSTLRDLTPETRNLKPDVR
jgi:hypothetical protein